ncbi:YgaP-like transmembrane domain [Pedobacter antarcticus]|uniref:Cyclase n=2 Tax=Pedobacter antarcticus TaxID=34086 RepID=A0A081PJC7_9SPHI|nr:YgaP-like transmembrane domain [Pedobacter antarcticus]KEQ30800.1 cyclase [Pedobacter antarcticus 4BY]SDM41410.1 Uncharacterized membrane protein [Pedobacter antarcticus]SFE93015.1 Uncharacterized membrane protein [Pedobacter antarcticus]
METHHQLKLHSGKFSIEKQHLVNIGLTERFVSVLAGGVLIGSALSRPFKSRFLYGAYLAYRGVTGHCLVYEQLGIDSKRPHAVNIRGEFIIDREASDLYNYWRNLNNLPGSLKHLLDVQQLDETTSAWKSKVLGHVFPVRWAAEIVKDEPGRLIGWRATNDPVWKHVGRVEFEPVAETGQTKLKIVLSYHPPAGGLGLGVARLINPYFEGLLSKEIINFKHHIESQQNIGA